ncbi:MAG TPA: chloride channel protein [Coriobacteriia bacterium]
MEPASPAARQRRLILDTLLLGVVGALGAQVFTLLLRGANWLFLTVIAGYTAPGLGHEGGSVQEVIGPHGLWLIPVATTLGGLIVGVLVQGLAPEAEGHGTDTVVRAFHRAEGFLRARVAPVKALASALTIGSGGSAGREGPVALIAGGIGSWYATVTGRSDKDRRLLLLIGAAAGLAAIFRSPVGTALLAIEVLYSEMEFESDALLYTMLASIVAYAVNGFFAGWEPLFRVPADLALPRVLDNGWFVVLGVGAGLIATALPAVFYGTRDAFRRLRVPSYLKPAIGGLLVGVMGLALPQVLAGGYGWMQAAIDGKLAAGTLLLLVFAKMIAMSCTVSSGGSGGVFAPALFIGGMLGGFLAAVVHLPPAPFVVVGMAAVFAGAGRVPIANMMMVTEMTGGYALLVPAALAVMISYLVQVRLSRNLRYRSLYEAQVPRRADSPSHHSEHLEIALRILEERKLTDPLPSGRRISLLNLLRSGIPVSLGAERRLAVGVVRADSPLVGRAVGTEGGQLDADTSIITIIRGEHMMAVRPDTVLVAGDRIILVTSAAGLERVKSQIDSW